MAIVKVILPISSIAFFKGAGIKVIILIGAACAGMFGVIGKFFAKLFRKKKSESVHNETNVQDQSETLQ
ncbi:hypothetical protein PPOLYM_01947 [Paenibacillus polymyxa]|uniref:hypothetical protein n=1 Tax=Paenibacillus polymyxa TaxID=1406 RepID=UPI00094740EE|nr:hypothetical protein [Paenibacillus polymyxa]APQ60691.1 hypothetical protein VK72_19210 [Paenibacillus polymyxa]VUG05566.1 hypothetical protein PPOLYM_01947 [Paenibacillus polymyxa]